MKVPEKLINYRVYKDSTDYIGLADVTLPTLEAMTETVSGAGIAGEVDSPTLGHYGSMETVLNWRTLEKTNMGLAAPNGRSPLGLRGLKYNVNIHPYQHIASQPSWAAWIEIRYVQRLRSECSVAALLGCVD